MRLFFWKPTHPSIVIVPVPVVCRTKSSATVGTASPIHFYLSVPDEYAFLMVSPNGIARSILSFAKYTEATFVDIEAQKPTLGIILPCPPTINDMVRIAHGLVYTYHCLTLMSAAVNAFIEDYGAMTLAPDPSVVGVTESNYYFSTLGAMTSEPTMSRFLIKCGLENEPGDFDEQG